MKQIVIISIISIFVFIYLSINSFAGIVGEESTGDFSTAANAQSSSGSSGTGGSGGNGGGDSSVSSNVSVTKAEKNETKKLKLVPGVGIKNNTKLQSAIEKVLRKEKMNENAIENLLRLSESITSDLETSRNFKYEDEKSTLSLNMKYKGNKKIKDFIIYDKIPKEFANSTDDITVIASKARVQVVEKDPEYAFIYDEIAPNQEIDILYRVSKEVNSSVLDDAKVEVYAFSLGDINITEEDIEKPITQISKTKIIVILLIIVVAVAVFVKTRKPKHQKAGYFYKYK